MSLPVITTNDEFSQYINEIKRSVPTIERSSDDGGSECSEDSVLDITIFDDIPIPDDIVLSGHTDPGTIIDQPRQSDSVGVTGDPIPFGYEEDTPEAPQTGRRARGWVFTWNNYDICTWYALEATSVKDEVVYLIVGREQAPTTGTLHLQGYIYFKSLKSFGQVLSYLLSMGANRQGHPFIAIARGNPKQNREYCSKGADFFEHGVLPGTGQGKRTDLDAVYESVVSGKSINELIDEHPTEMIKYAKNIMLMNNLINYQAHRTTRPRVYWFFGPTGSGKSRIANQIAKMTHSFYYKNPAHKWWDGYTQQECIVVDDYRRDFSTFAELLRLLDWYPYSVECKGGTLALNSACIIFTSPKAPRATWENRSEEDLSQLVRRIDNVVQFPRSFPLDLNSILTQIRTPP